MRLNADFKNKIILAVVILTSWSVNAQTIIFNPGDHCKKYGTTYRECLPIPREGVDLGFGPQSVSQTENKFIQALMYNSVINYDYRCRGREDPTFLSFESQKMRLTFDGAGQIQTAVKYNTASQYKLIRESRGFSMINLDCHLSITSNVTLPQLEPIKWYVSNLEESLKEFIETKKMLSEGETLPSKWSVIETLPGKIQNQIDGIDDEINFTKTELEDLLKIPAESQSPYEKSRIEEIQGQGGVLENLQAQKIDRVNLLSDVNSVLGSNIAQKCKTSADEETAASCLVAIENVEKSFETLISHKKSEMISLQQFLLEESKRIAEADRSLAREINNLIKRLAI
jgi:hypothetical protein